MVNLSRAMNGAGLAVMRFDFTGLGESEGDFADTSFVSNVDDLVAAARYLEAEHAAPKILVGHSLAPRSSRRRRRCRRPSRWPRSERQPTRRT